MPIDCHYYYSANQPTHAAGVDLKRGRRLNICTFAKPLGVGDNILISWWLISASDLGRSAEVRESDKACQGKGYRSSSGLGDDNKTLRLTILISYKYVTTTPRIRKTSYTARSTIVTKVVADDYPTLVPP